MKIEIGDWFIRKERWLVEAREAIKVSSKLVFWQCEHFNRPFRVRLEDVVFVGPQAAARRLAQQLTSSQAQQFDEERGARERREARDIKLIEDAKSGANA